MFIILVTLTILPTNILSFGCPLICECVGTGINCRMAGWKVVPQVPNTTTSLNLFGNEIKNFREGDFDGLVQLEMLNLYGNQLTLLPQNVFRDLQNMIELWLQNNQITEIKEGAFNGLVNLEKLYLYGNKLTGVSKDIFKGLHNLTELRLDYNQISNIESHTFDDLRNLKTLDLSKNPLFCHCSLMSFVINAKVQLTTRGHCKQPEGLVNASLSDLTMENLNCVNTTITWELSTNTLDKESNEDKYGITTFTTLVKNRTEITKMNISTIPTTSSNNGNSLYIIIGFAIVIPVIILSLIIYFAYKRILQHRRKKEAPQPLPPPDPEELHVYEELYEQALSHTYVEGNVPEYIYVIA